MIKNINAEILANDMIYKDFYHIKISVPDIAKYVSPGQFVMIKTSKTLTPFLKRPISIYKVEKEQGIIHLLYQLVGTGTRLMSQLKKGESLEVLGPLGNGFGIYDNDNTIAIVGGGCGIAPLVALAYELRNTGKNVHALIGAQDIDRLICYQDFELLGCDIFAATDDGSFGYKGYVTDLLDSLLAVDKVDRVYCCGPLPMTQKVIEITTKKGVFCEVSLEERMACGLGACLGCAVKIKSSNGEITYKKVCQDGPVFSSDEVILDV